MFTVAAGFQPASRAASLPPYVSAPNARMRPALAGFMNWPCAPHHFPRIVVHPPRLCRIMARLSDMVDATTTEAPYHQGHRQHLRERFRKCGVPGFAEHEVAELLVNLCIVGNGASQAFEVEVK